MASYRDWGTLARGGRPRKKFIGSFFRQRVLQLERLESRYLLSHPGIGLGRLEGMITYDVNLRAGSESEASSKVYAFTAPITEFARQTVGPHTDPIDQRNAAVFRVENDDDGYNQFSVDSQLDTYSDFGGAPFASIYGGIDEARVRDQAMNANVSLEVQLSVELTAIPDGPARGDVAINSLVWLQSADFVQCHFHFYPSDWDNCSVEESSQLDVSIRSQAHSQGMSSDLKELHQPAADSAVIRSIETHPLVIPWGSTYTLKVNHIISGVMNTEDGFFGENRLTFLDVEFFAQEVEKDIDITASRLNSHGEDLFEFDYEVLQHEGPIDFALVHSQDMSFDPDTAVHSYSTSDPSRDVIVADATRGVRPGTDSSTIALAQPIRSQLERPYLLLVAMESNEVKDVHTVCSMPNSLWEDLEDFDGDALPDCAEILGYVWPVEGHDRLVALPEMGADPRVKDVFVEADTMSDRHLDKQAIGKVIQAFLDAPVGPEYAGGPMGINLHIDSGSDSVMNPRTGETWGQKSQSNRIPDSSFTFLTPYGWGTFDDYKDANRRREFNFDETSTNLSEARRPAFHYAILANSFGPLWNALGITGSSRPRIAFPSLLYASDDFVINLAKTPSADHLAATFMHELGHNLGLQHGGQDSCQDKPNYLSVMNYTYTQVYAPGLVRAAPNGEWQYGIFDYSTNSLLDLYEFSLNESIGLGSDANDWGIRWYLNGAGKQKVHQNSLDWNANGTLESGVIADLNMDVLCINLESFSDWDKLDFDGGLVGGLAVERQDNFVSLSDVITEPDDRQFLPPYWFDAQVPERFEYELGSTAQTPAQQTAMTYVSLTLTNGGLDDTYQVTATSPNAWVSNFSEHITVPSGESRIVDVLLQVPENAGPIEQISIVVQSENAEYSWNAYSILAVTDRKAPSIDDVTLSSSTWSSEYSNQIDGGGRSIAEHSAHAFAQEFDTIKVEFSEDVFVLKSDLVLDGGTLNPPSINSFAYDEFSHTATWTLSEPIPSDRWLLEFSSQIQDHALHQIDPPSPAFMFDILVGDMTSDDRVAQDDVDVIVEKLGTAIGDPEYVVSLDLDGNGSIDDEDRGMIESRLGDALKDLHPQQAPRISYVSLGSTKWTRDFEYSEHGVHVGVADQALPWSDLDIVTVGFDKQVQFSENSLSLYRDGEKLEPIGWQYDGSQHAMSWLFPERLQSGSYEVMLDDTVVGINGHRIDGDATQSVFPSGDGVAGGKLRIEFLRQIGDIDGDGIVGSIDADAINVAMDVMQGEPEYRPELDLNGNGAIDASDLRIVQMEFPTAWQNPTDRYDVNVSGESTTVDALVILNLLARMSSSSVDVSTLDYDSDPRYYYDVNASRTVSALDALQVINHLARITGANGEFIVPFGAPDAVADPSLQAHREENAADDERRYLADTRDGAILEIADRPRPRVSSITSVPVSEDFDAENRRGIPRLDRIVVDLVFRWDLEVDLPHLWWKSQ